MTITKKDLYMKGVFETMYSEKIEDMLNRCISDYNFDIEQIADYTGLDEDMISRFINYYDIKEVSHV